MRVQDNANGLFSLTLCRFEHLVLLALDRGVNK